MFGQPSYLGVATADWVAALKSSDSLERRLAAHARRGAGGAGEPRGQGRTARGTEVLRPSVQPNFCSPCKSAARRACPSESSAVRFMSTPIRPHALALLRARRERPHSRATE